MEKISPRITVLLEKLIVAQLIKKFAAVCETRTFTTVVRIAQIWALFQIG
jgi:hypothetical protein